ncbi:hypothetical protein ACFKH8_005390, partial [Salmonella enterica]
MYRTVPGPGAVSGAKLTDGGTFRVTVPLPPVVVHIVSESAAYAYPGPARTDTISSHRNSAG